MEASLGATEFRAVAQLSRRSALIAFPFLIALFLEVFVLPIDFFTFRVWEAALATPYRYPGAFYPNLHVYKAREYGDRYREGDEDKVQAKPVEWFIDGYGWRNRPETEQDERYDVVLLGDSNIVGSFLDQHDTLSEALSGRASKVVYSYSYGSDHIGLYFSDPRLRRKSGPLLVVESKVGNWQTTQDYLKNFREMPDGSLDLVDRTQEFSDNFYAANRSLYLERIESRLTKQATFHWLKANLQVVFTLATRAGGDSFLGFVSSAGADRKVGWRPGSWVVENGTFNPLTEEPQPALRVRATGANAYWHTEPFIATNSDAKIVVRFEAKNSITPSRHRIWIFEDGSYRSVGEFVAEGDWRRFEIPISTNPNSTLELQIDQPDNWQSLSIRDFQVIEGGPVPFVQQTPVAISMNGWTAKGVPCGRSADESEDCRQWFVAGKAGYVRTPILPQPGGSGLLIRFQARTDRPATTFTPIYLFEGDKYRVVGQFAFGSQWREFSLSLRPDRKVPIKVQVDYPDAVGSLLIRKFQAIPIDPFPPVERDHAG
jgi:hypothetical protein